MKKLICLLLLVCTVLSLASCSRRPKDFQAAEMTITLTRAFKRSPVPGFTACYHTKEVMVMIIKEPMNLKEGFLKLTVEEYVEEVREANKSKSPSEAVCEDGLIYYTYVYRDDSRDKTYVYLCAAYKSTGAFWLVQFATPEEDYQTHREDILTWAKSVHFEE